MSTGVVRIPFTIQLVTIPSKKSFHELVDRIENTFQYYDAKILRDLTAKGDTEKLTEYVKQVGGETEFAIFYSLDQGSTQRLAGIPDRISLLSIRQCNHSSRTVSLFSAGWPWSARPFLCLSERRRGCPH